MKILVTGAAGFIGSHLVDYLINDKHEIFGVDDLSGGFKSNVNPKCKFSVLDLRLKAATISYILKIKPQIIYHLAADATEGRSQFTPLESTERNLNAYLPVLIGGIKTGIQRLVLFSSMSVYGNQPAPFNEEMPCQPVDVYGIVKTAMEYITKVLAQVHRYEYTILRPHNVYGPRQNLSDPYRNVIGIFINRLLQNKPFYIYGNGKQKRAFSYIDDIIPFIVKAGLQKNTRNKIINIGPQTVYTINVISQIILSHFVKNVQKIPVKIRPKYLPSRPLEVENAICTDTKSRLLLGFKPTTSIKTGIEKTVVWAKTIGPQQFKYLNQLELTNREVPLTWSNKLL